MSAPAPLRGDALALAAVLLEELPDGPPCAALRERLHRGALALVEDVTLALSGFSPDERLADADEALCVLRAHLLLARELELLDDELYLALAEQADGVGRQLGGLLRSRQ